jgi:peptidoglycan/xylan/chitin deacetylase (PgdA/CDA1 family)
MPRASAASPIWRPVCDELSAWLSEGRTVRLWLRDDDAVADTAALRRYADLIAEYGVPGLLAVIPARATAGLADLLARHPLFDPAVHGYAHANHARAGEKAQEFPIERGIEVIRAELGLARQRLVELFGERLTGIFVPPWNRISPAVAQLLPDLGFSALSTFGNRPLLGPNARLREINTHIDIIDWRGNRGGRDHAWLARELAAQLELARGQNREHVGILTHHLVHDNTAWRFLEALLALVAQRPGVVWCRASELIEEHGSSG